ncbi:MAG: hypothetical protein Q8R39_00905 [bacterium]|nr:hypothetical protein [bacterium]MDZ4285235.1 hypothetical protein [Patescibacteria group bacterium]
MAKYPKTLGRIEAVWNKLGGEEGVDRFLRGELSVSEPARRWREENGVISFTVMSDGTTGPRWIPRLEKNGFHIGDHAKNVLRSLDFKPTSGVTTEIEVLKGILFDSPSRITSKIRAEARRRNLEKPNAEVACLIREMFPDKEIEAMGLCLIMAMHEPIKDSDDDLLRLLISSSLGHGGRWLGALEDWPDAGRSRDSGLAFAKSSTSA